MQKHERKILKIELLQTMQRNPNGYAVWCDTTCGELNPALFDPFTGKTRRFRFDYAIAEIKFAIELNGGQWVNGRHNRGGKAYETDLTKLNLAQLNGWSVYQFTYEMLKRGEHNTVLEHIGCGLVRTDKEIKRMACELFRS